MDRDLIVGESYFMVTYPDPSMSAPIVITYTYLGKDPEGIEEDEPGPQYYFRYLPAFQSEIDEVHENASENDGWMDVFPNLFSGWGERVPTSFSQEKLRGFNTLEGLIEELTRVRDGRRP